MVNWFICYVLYRNSYCYSGNYWNDYSRKDQESYWFYYKLFLIVFVNKWKVVYMGLKVQYTFARKYTPIGLLKINCNIKPSADDTNVSSALKIKGILYVNI